MTWVAVVAACVLVALLVGPPGSDGPPLDPSSTGPSGTKGLVDTLRELGARVRVDRVGPDADLVPPPSRGPALLLIDALSEEQRTELDEWTRAGGTLVLADPSSALNPLDVGTAAAVGPIEPDLRRNCRVPALQDVDRVVAPGAVLLPVPRGGTGCFTREGDAWLVILAHGRGTLVVLGGAGAFTNAHLGEADNAVLASSLLAPTPGVELTLPWVERTGSGSKGLGDLISPGVKLGFLQLGLAFLIVILWRGRRLGLPVVESQPVAVEGSETVAAVGRLLQRARARRQAAGLLRDDLRRDLASRLGLPVDAPAEAVADVVSSRSGVSRDRVLAVLAGGDPAGEEALVDLAQSVEAIRREVEHGR